MSEHSHSDLVHKIQHRRDIEEDWILHDPVLSQGEIGITLGDPVNFKIGDGSSIWSDLPHLIDHSGKTLTEEMLLNTLNAIHGISKLDENGKIFLKYLPLAEPNGIASLGDDGKIPLSQLLVATADGLATLGADGKIPAAQLPALKMTEDEILTVLGAQYGVSKLDEYKLVPMNKLHTNESGGLPILDEYTKLPVSYLHTNKVNGVPLLDNQIKIPMDLLYHGTSGALAVLGADDEMAMGNLPINRANCLVALDANSKIPLTYLYLDDDDGLIVLDGNGQIPLQYLNTDPGGLLLTDANDSVPMSRLYVDEPNGVPGLDSIGKVPTNLLYINRAGGLITLDSFVKIPMDVLYKNVASGVVTLDSNVKIPLDRLYINKSGGLVTLDSSVKIPMDRLYTNVDGGIALLDSDGKLGVNYLHINEAYGVPTLDSNVKIPMDRLYTDTADGIPLLDSSGKIPTKLLYQQDNTEEFGPEHWGTFIKKGREFTNYGGVRCKLSHIADTPFINQYDPIWESLTMENKWQLRNASCFQNKTGSGIYSSKEGAWLTNDINISGSQDFDIRFKWNLMDLGYSSLLSLLESVDSTFQLRFNVGRFSLNGLPISKILTTELYLTDHWNDVHIHRRASDGRLTTTLNGIDVSDSSFGQPTYAGALKVRLIGVDYYSKNCSGSMLNVGIATNGHLIHHYPLTDNEVVDCVGGNHGELNGYHAWTNMQDILSYKRVAIGSWPGVLFDETYYNGLVIVADYKTKHISGDDYTSTTGEMISPDQHATDEGVVFRRYFSIETHYENTMPVAKCIMRDSNIKELVGSSISGVSNEGLSYGGVDISQTRVYETSGSIFVQLNTLYTLRVRGWFDYIRKGVA